MASRLATMLRAHRDWSMRTRAARALRPSRRPEAAPRCVRRCAPDAYAFVREAAAGALASGAQEEDVAALERAPRERRGAPGARRGAHALLAAGGEPAARACAPAPPPTRARSSARPAIDLRAAPGVERGPPKASEGSP
ncbi:MAG: hypothetical protein M5U28_35470 [Sandaracinaceae bacterium]|nr:hypothetical protein [Sandaracinaceae bacterium]